MARTKMALTSKGWQQVASEFKHRSDRSTALVGAAYLEGHLGQIIRGFCVDDETAVDGLLDAEHPLGSFRARIRAAYCLGLISKNENHDLERILEVRDIFTEQVYSASFNDAQVREACLALKIPRSILESPLEQTPRQLFIFAVALLAQQLAFRAEQAAKDRRGLPDEFMLVDAEND
ncbi:MAG: hypothetical protein JW862_05570 [Anaerolineales bacterium]|nr:hypothetical protein [Anaerolineales bacterium]